MKNLLIIVVSLFLVGGVGFLMYNSYSNQEIRLRNKVEAKKDVNKTTYDAMWKIINGDGKVAKQYKEDFKDVYTSIVSARNYDGGGVLSFLQEHNPQFDASLYSKISRAIEAEYNNFSRDQKELISVIEQHTNLVTTFPGSLFLGSRDLFDASQYIVTSTKTENAFESGKDDEIKIFD